MRAIRVLAVAALMSLGVSAASAQTTRHFENSWFWGVKGGLLSYQVFSDTSAFTWMAGGDWMITRKKGGLYVAYDHSFLGLDSVFVNDSLSPLDTAPRVVHLRGLRRFTFSGVLFPFDNDRLYPYIGAGVTLSAIASAEPQGQYRNGTQQNLVLNTVATFKSVAAPTFMIGTQLRLPFLPSAFIQATATPASNNFFLFMGQGWRTTVEAGARYNAGSSIDEMRKRWLKW
jgi:hypothetical protein